MSRCGRAGRADAAIGYERQVGGDLLPYASRTAPHRNHVLPLRLAPGATGTPYLRLASQGTVSAPVRLWRPRALWAVQMHGGTIAVDSRLGEGTRFTVRLPAAPA